MVWPDAQQNSGCDPLRQRDEPGIELTAQNSPKPHGGKVGDEQAPLTMVWPDGQQ